MTVEVRVNLRPVRDYNVLLRSFPRYMITPTFGFELWSLSIGR